MRFKYDDFPIRETPIYDFYIADNNELRVRKHYRYETEHIGNGRLCYRIHTGVGITTKREDQMDRVLAGHVFTLEYDPDKIFQLMLQRAEADAVKAAVLVENAKSCKESIQVAAKKAIVEETYRTILEQKPKRAWSPVE